MKKKIILFLVILVSISFLLVGPSYSQESPTPIPTPTSDSSSLSSIPECLSQKLTKVDCVTYLQNKASDLRSQVNTLSSQIAVMDNQINLTEARIESNKQQIADITLDIDTAQKRISKLETSLDSLTAVLAKRITATYEVGTIQPLQVLLSSSDANNFLSRLNYLRIAQAHDKKVIYDTVQAKNDYQNQKDLFEEKKKKIEALKKQLENYTAQLEKDKGSKQALLAQTQGNEANYRKLLAQAQAEIAALSSFARSRFGGGLVPHSELSDDWGRYYNQRDANWGNNRIGSSSETIVDVGCLLTSYAMVSSHYGNNVAPADVAANSSNFWFSTALFLKPGPSANGHGAQSVYSPALDYLKDQLNSGHAVIAGLSYDSGSIADHWIVLRSVDGDSFRINDPLYAGAINVSLKDHYNGLRIVEARIYN